MRKPQMIRHVLVAYEAGLPRGAGQGRNQRIRKPMVAPRSHFETANGVIVERQASGLNLFSALVMRRLVGYDDRSSAHRLAHRSRGIAA
jgi:hypothetical protein